MSVVNKKNDEKGYFFRAGQCAALSSFRVGKMLFLYGNWKGYIFFTILQKVAKVRELAF